MRLQEVQVGEGVVGFLRDRFITRQSQNIEKTHRVRRAHVSNERTEDRMTRGVRVVHDETELHA